MPWFFSVKNGVYLHYVRGTSFPPNHGAMGAESPKVSHIGTLVGWKKNPGNPMVASKPGIIFCLCKVGIEYIPGTQMTSIFEGQPHMIRPKFHSKQGFFGFQVCIYIYILWYI